MKVKKLIELLQDLDPTGEEEVSVDNQDIQYVDYVPSYYDGNQAIFIRNESDYYHIEGLKYRSEGYKIVLHCSSIDFILFDNPDLPIDLSELTPEKAKIVQENHDKIISNAIKIKQESELNLFINFVQKRCLGVDYGYIKYKAKDFFEKNKINFTDNLIEVEPKKEKGYLVYPSYAETRELQWDAQYEITVVDNNLIIKSKNDKS